MKKKIIFIFLIYLFSSISLNAEQKIAYIDIDFLFSNSAKGKKIIKSLNEISKNNFDEISKNEKKITTLSNEINLKKNILSKEEIQIMADNLNQLISDIRQNKETLLTNFEAKKKQEIQFFFNDIKPIIDDYMEKKLITVIFDKKNIFIANQNHDITQDILKLIGN